MSGSIHHYNNSDLNVWNKVSTEVNVFAYRRRGGGMCQGEVVPPPVSTGIIEEIAHVNTHF